MSQTILTRKGSKKVTKIEQLYIERMFYYNELVRQLKLLEQRKISLIKDFKLTTKQYDDAISKEHRLNKKNDKKI